MLHTKTSAIEAKNIKATTLKAKITSPQVVNVDSESSLANLHFNAAHFSQLQYIVDSMLL